MVARYQPKKTRPVKSLTLRKILHEGADAVGPRRDPVAMVHAVDQRTELWGRHRNVLAGLKVEVEFGEEDGYHWAVVIWRRRRADDSGDNQQRNAAAFAVCAALYGSSER